MFGDHAHRLLTHEEEMALARRVRAGGPDAQTARDELILCNLRLVLDYNTKFDKQPADFEDDYQAGITGLVRAAEKYDPDKGTRFATYATWHIRAAIQQSRRVRKPIVIPAHVYSTKQEDLSRKIKDAILAVPAQIMEQHEYHLFHAPSREPSPTEVDKPRDLAVWAIEAANLGSKADSIIRRRYGLDGPVETLEEIGNSLGVSKERIRQIQAAAEKKIYQAALRCRSLKIAVETHLGVAI